MTYMRVGFATNPNVVQALQDLLGKTRPGTAARAAVEDYVEALAWARRQVAGLFDRLTQAFVDTVGIGPEGVVAVPPLRLAERPPSVALLEALDLGIDEIARRAGVQVYDDYSGGDLLAAWGTALGRALGMDALHATALGEFCRAWVTGLSCRYGNLDLLVAEAEFAFAGALTGRVGTGVVMWTPPLPRRLFPDTETEKDETEKESYRLAWRAVLSLLAGHAKGRFQEDPERVRVVDDQGQVAALVVLQEEIEKKSV